jgi:hypothetical protein
MKKRKTRLLSVTMILLLTLVACNFVAPTGQSTPPPLTMIIEPTSAAPKNILQSEAEVPRTPVEQALVALQSGAAVIVDVRSAQAYEESHVEGAISIPLAEIETNPNGLALEKDQWIITYCT